MSTVVKVSAFAAALVAVFALAWAIGSAVGPLDEAPPPAGEHHGHHPGGTP
ncbi:hypothetical protein [Amycolatopsis sp. WAC 01375]|uniref:hypothetical protein n=1 Tax=Amycolatopsis sp. WAC 01375 TaxID=2203194 RepID=UPI0018F61C14|nr:hypothetical protein [Amycolatopsis sp. WAC 01375]